MPIRLSAFARSAYERLVVDVGYVDAAQRAAPNASAILINSFADYGIDAMRAALAVPIIGAGEATLLAAARLAQRFAIVTVWPESMRFLYTERLRALELADRCTSILHVSPEAELSRLGSADGVMERMHRRETSVLEQLRAACKLAIERDGADCIVLGCTCMAPVGPELAASCSRPVLESSRIGYAASIAAARQPHNGSVARADRMQLVSLVDAWAGQATSNHSSSEPDCPVCEPEPANS